MSEPDCRYTEMRLGTTEITVHIDGGRCTLVVTEGPDKAPDTSGANLPDVQLFAQDISAVVPPMGVFIGREALPALSGHSLEIQLLS